MSSIRPFHLAFPVTDIQKTRKWYQDILGCKIGRESDTWIDFDLFGHQVVAHLVESIEISGYSDVDSKKIPAMHFGVILEWKDCIFSEKLKKKIEFV